MIFLGCVATLLFGRLEGWYYFEEPRCALSPEEADAVLKMQKERHQNLLALALMDPTRENIANYIEEHRKVSKESLRFAATWSDIVENGLLDPALGERYFLLFCFRGQESESKPLAEIARKFAASYHWTLKGLALDGQRIEGIDCESDSGLGQMLPCEETPCFYAIDPVENFALPLGSDIASEDELIERIMERCEP